MRKTRDKSPTVCILATPQCSGAVLYGLYEVLSGFGQGWTQVTGTEDIHAGFEVRIVALKKKPFTCIGGVPVTPHAALTDIAQPDILIIPDLALDPEIDHRHSWQPYSKHLAAIHNSGGTLASVCSGSLVLAGCGFLTNRKATTHWGYFEHFQKFFPEVDLQSNRILVTEHENEGILTTGGMSSWEDLTLYLIARFFGEAAAIKTAKLFLLGDRGEGQLLFAALNKRKRVSDKIISDILEWVSSNYDIQNPVAEMAARSGLSTRTFKRRFKTATGYTPIEYVQTLRIEEAKQMLESGNDSIDDVSLDVGYEDSTSFRRLFKRMTGVTPSRYRQRFQSMGSRQI